MHKPISLQQAIAKNCFIKRLMEQEGGLLRKSDRNVRPSAHNELRIVNRCKRGAQKNEKKNLPMVL